MTTYKPRRSVLYMPGSNERALEKAKTLNVDGLIFDLEDAVAPESKEVARSQISEAVKNGGYGRREIIIRINGFDTPWGVEDMKMAAAAAPDAILVPKVSKREDVVEIAQAMTEAPERTRLWAMMETALCVVNAAEIAACAAEPDLRISCFVLGTNDLSKETRASLDNLREAVLPWLSTCVVAARSYGVDLIDGVCNNFRDMIVFREECIQGRNLGMDGKTLIHPAQIGPCNEIFSPDPEEVAWSHKVIDVFELPENKGKGAAAVDGRMVELHHVEIARRIVAIDEAIKQAEAAA